jgi:hypothetical protein
MSQEHEKDMRPEYDIRGGVRGKYVARRRFRAAQPAAQGAQVHVQASPWVQLPTTESLGEHPREATVHRGARPIYVLHPEIGQPVEQ